MKKVVLSKFDIVRELALLPSSGLNEIDAFIKSLLYKNNNNLLSDEPKSLSGIWKNKGFEKIKNPEEEISNARKEISLAIEKKLNNLLRLLKTKPYRFYKPIRFFSALLFCDLSRRD